MSEIFAGALQGLGRGLVAYAEQQREDALYERRKKDREAYRQAAWDRDDRLLEEKRAYERGKERRAAAAMESANRAMYGLDAATGATEKKVDPARDMGRGTSPGYRGDTVQSNGKTYDMGRKVSSAAPEDRDLLAKLITAEAGNQGYEGMLAVGSVIGNRMKSSRYPNAVRDVLMQPGQFSPLNSKTGYANGEQGQDVDSIRASEDAYRVADAILAGAYDDPTGGALNFYNPDISDPVWGRNMAKTRIGDHVFGTSGAGALREQEAVSRGETRLGMIGGVKNDRDVYQGFDAKGRAHASNPEYADYSQLFREYRFNSPDDSWIAVGKRDGKTVYAAPDYARDESGNYLSVSAAEAERLAQDRGSIIPTRDEVKAVYDKAKRVRMPTSADFGKKGGEGTSEEYTALVTQRMRDEGIGPGDAVVHGKEFYAEATSGQGSSQAGGGLRQPRGLDIVMNSENPFATTDTQGNVTVRSAGKTEADASKKKRAEILLGIIGNPDVDYDTRRRAASNLDKLMEKDDKINLEGEEWIPTGDGKETLHRYNGRTNEAIPVTRNGEPVTRAMKKTAPELSKATKSRLRLALRRTDMFIDDGIADDIETLVGAEVMRLMKEENMSEAQAIDSAVSRLETDDVGSPTGVILPPSQPQPTPTMPSDPGTPPSASRQPSPDGRTLPAGVTAQSALDQARKAIEAGANRSEVEARLRSYGIDPKGL
ncbi:cell wall hydrolase [Roseovarius sp.]|uniref:cell wall hydrolase n=1 Tax=Roseovarius sp. TaxID=1486281 RepID=UPI003BA8564D